MIQKDVLMRQIQMLTQALARVLFKKSAGQQGAAQQIIAEALGELDGVDRVSDLRERPVEDVLDLCRSEAGGFSPDFALAVADLLREDGDLLAMQERDAEACASYERALALYRRAEADEHAAVPMDFAARVAHVEERLRGG